MLGGGPRSRPAGPLSPQRAGLAKTNCEFRAFVFAGVLDYHRHRRPHRRAAGRKPLITADEYVQRGLLDSARFQAVPATHAIKTPSGRGSVAQQNRAGAWKARWLHVPCWTPAAAGSDRLYVRWEGEAKYHVVLLNFFGRYSC